MKDYFLDYCDARAELAGSRVTIENLVRALEIESPILKLASLKMAKQQLASINKALEK